MWIRLAFASFGITTPVLSVVLSVFMAGLALGSWAGGRLVSRAAGMTAKKTVFYYALTEGLTGLGGLTVPWLFHYGKSVLLPLGDMDSVSYLSFSGAALALSLLPWCLCMGATFPFAMAFLRHNGLSQGSFSFLYTANVLGAVTGTAASVLLIEILGFRDTLVVAASLNGAVLGMALWQSRRAGPPSTLTREALPDPGPSPGAQPFHLPLLFLTGFASMAMEVLWTRDFTIVLKTQVYSYASLLLVYLLATFLGSLHYRRSRGRKVYPAPLLLAAAFASALLTVVLNDIRVQATIPGVLLSIVPFCAVLGYMTPKWIDDYSGGNAQRASLAYAVNILGCVLGPLAASFLLLPWGGIRLSLVLLAGAFLPFLFWTFRPAGRPSSSFLAIAGLGVVLSVLSLFWSLDYEQDFGIFFPDCVIRRDYAATVVNCSRDGEKRLYVNGIPMTAQGTECTIMAHLPLAFLSHAPRSALDICFGMGTTFRSLLSWSIRGTAVELAPGVLKSFGYYYPDADRLENSPSARLVVDDGRRFLERTREQYDLITIDPPPPPEAAGSSLLYSTEFYEIAKRHLAPGGILQQWLPGGEIRNFQAVTGSLVQAFPYVRVFTGINGTGCHYLASLTPLPNLDARQLSARLPPAAKADFVEWSPGATPEELFRKLLEGEMPPSSLINPKVDRRIEDDRPYNEYYLLRRLSLWLRGRPI